MGGTLDPLVLCDFYTARYVRLDLLDINVCSFSSDSKLAVIRDNYYGIVWYEESKSHDIVCHLSYGEMTNAMRAGE